MGERRRRTLGRQGAQPDPVRHIAYGTGADRSEQPSPRWLEKLRRRTRCDCGIELPVTGKCDYCD
jgi:hypothetical protein